MKKPGILLITILISLGLNAQKDCKVFVIKLKGEYTGECKKGKADGQGTSIGKETYTGEWIKGYPSGMGKYTYENGDAFEGIWKRGRKHGFGKYFKKVPNGVEIKTGYWESDIYIGEKELMRKYVILKKEGVDRIRFVYHGNSKNSVLLTFTSGNRNTYSRPESLRVSNTSGIESFAASESNILYEDVKFPLDMNLHFIGYYKLQKRTKLNCELLFTINLPGEWEVIIEYQN